MATQATEGSAAGQAPLVQHGSEVLQLLSSDHPGMVLVSSPLDGKNFLAWSRAVKRALGAKMKLGFIIGTCKKPSGDPDLIEQWTRVHCMVASWLLNAMTKNVSNAFIYAKSARTLWIALNERYGECNSPYLYQLERDIASITQGYSRFSGTEAAYSVPYGTNDEYDNVRSQILVIEPLPSVNRAYSMILRVERQRQVHLNVAVKHDGVVMHAGNFEKRKEGNTFRRKGIVDKRSLKCAHCDKTGHDKSTYFKLHGVPDWYKELGDQKRKSNAGHRAYAIQQEAEKLKEVTKDNATSVSDVVMELVRVLKQIPNDPIQDHLTKTVVAIAKQSRHLYILDKDSFNPAFINQFLSSHFSFVSQVVGSDLSLWHQKLGHPSDKFLVSRDVVFHEHLFPFQSNSSLSTSTHVPIPLIPLSSDEDIPTPAPSAHSSPFPITTSRSSSPVSDTPPHYLIMLQLLYH
ncbi:UNVERIFIED_CONTAM: hypothetical protein Slati_4514700 [Sesamum latifolium]|uniref:Retrotransposon Copia-like N-terminal domain-containing protein n=1 Tax=Sesamum latifolium TaxID=2727402 RepID=A0AAW2SSN9_9LAMI